MLLLSYVTSHTWASALRQVKCTFCQTEFFYSMRCRGIASSTVPLGLERAAAETGARSAAGKKLSHALAHEIDAIPCPTCQRLQPNMISLLRWRFIKPI